MDIQLENVNYKTYKLDKNSISEIGKIFGVKNLLIVYVVPIGWKIHMGTVRLVDVETATALTSTTFVVKEFGEDVNIAMKQVAIDIVTVLKNKKRVINDELFNRKVTKDTHREAHDLIMEYVLIVQSTINLLFVNFS